MRWEAKSEFEECDIVEGGVQDRCTGTNGWMKGVNTKGERI
jgi:hypothetical protein